MEEVNFLRPSALAPQKSYVYVFASSFRFFHRSVYAPTKI